uniref:Uncharacterized protein n=1 Tax=Acrobeloides nanus TaxID=290746 RepID=A0A914CMQ7_9BILA
MLYELRAVNDEQDYKEHKPDNSDVAHFGKPIFDHEDTHKSDSRRSSLSDEENKKVHFDCLSTGHQEHKPVRKMTK